jgi:ABC-2 type transport system permease protein
MTTTAPAQREVGPAATAALAHRVLLRQVVTRGRLVAMGLLGVAVILLGWAIGAAEIEGDELEAAVSIVANVGFAIVVPVVALVFAAGVLGETREDGTLVYLWLRPLHRAPIVLGAYGAALTVIVPLTVVPVVASAAALDVGATLVVAALMASLVGVVAYAAVFLLLGLLLKNAIVWGLAYILVWEGIAAALGTGPSRLAIRGYTRSILTDRTGVDLELADLSQLWGVVVPLAVAAVALALATWRLNRLDVA